MPWPGQWPKNWLNINYIALSAVSRKGNVKSLHRYRKFGLKPILRVHVPLKAHFECVRIFQ